MRFTHVFVPIYKIFPFFLFIKVTSYFKFVFGETRYLRFINPCDFDQTTKIRRGISSNRTSK